MCGRHWSLPFSLPPTPSPLLIGIKIAGKTIPVISQGYSNVIKNRKHQSWEIRMRAGIWKEMWIY